MRLVDVIRIVSQYSRNERELALAVADLINRGRVKIGGLYHNHRVVVS
jgi:hypothetical protein